MRILQRYVLREFLTPVLYCLVAFASLYMTIELFSEFDKIIPARPSAKILLRYVGGYISKDFQWLVTPSLLLGGLYAMWQLSRHSEITAMRSNGVGFSEITAPILASSLLFALLMVLNSEFYAPNASRDASAIKSAGFKEIPHNNIHEKIPYNNPTERRDWLIDKFDSDTGHLSGIKITWTDTEGRQRRVLTAEAGDNIDGTWWFTNAKQVDYRDDTAAGARVYEREQDREMLVMPELTELPKDFVLEILRSSIVEDSENLSARDMIRYISARPNLTREMRASWVYDIANRFTAPLACLVITLFAIPAGVATGRQSVFVGVLSAILLFLTFYVLTITCGVLAKKCAIPIAVGVTLPNLVFLCAGLCMFWKQR